MPMEKWPGTPDAGNPHVRCDEGEGAASRPLSTLLPSVANCRPRRGWKSDRTKICFFRFGENRSQSCSCSPKWLPGVGPSEWLGENGIEVVDELNQPLLERLQGGK